MGTWNAMEYRSKPGQVFTLKTQFIDKSRRPSGLYKAVICGLVVAFVSLSCAIGVLDQSDPLFTTSKGGGLQSPTPSLNFPTDRAVSNKTNNPVVEQIQPLSTEIATQASDPVDTAPLLYYT